MKEKDGRTEGCAHHAVQAEIAKWIDLATESPVIEPSVRLALCELGVDLADYMGLAICSVLTELQLSGAITINEAAL